MQQKIQQCLKLQDRLNSIIDPDWKSNRIPKDFYRAIWLECAEAVESLPWKWWKHTEPNWDNVKIEIVDIWHFILSLAILEEEDLSDFLDGLEDLYVYDDLTIYLFERIAESALLQDFESVLYFFGNLVKETISFEELYKTYVGKNLLNILRQELGYNDGTYNKIIDGKEDNEYLIELLNKYDDLNTIEEELRKILTRG